MRGFSRKLATSDFRLYLVSSIYLISLSLKDFDVLHPAIGLGLVLISIGLTVWAFNLNTRLYTQGNGYDDVPYRDRE